MHRQDFLPLLENIFFRGMRMIVFLKIALYRTICFATSPLQMAPIIIEEKKLSVFSDSLKNGVAFLSSHELDQKQTTYLPDIMNFIPGVHVVQSGGRGHFASFFIRGLVNHTDVYVDGIRLNNPATANGGFDSANFTALGLENIIVQRSPVSTTYGGSGGGVIHMRTEEGSEQFISQGLLETGSRGTYHVKGNIQGSYNNVRANLSASHYQTEGKRIYPPRLQLFTNQNLTSPYSNFHINGRLDGQLTDDVILTLFSRFIQSDLNYHMYLGTKNASSFTQQTEQYSQRLQLKAINPITKAIYELSTSYFSLEQSDFSPFSKNQKTTSRGQRFQVDYNLIYPFSEKIEATFHINMEKEKLFFYNRFIPQATASCDLMGISISPKWTPLSWLLVEGGVRFDHSSKYSLPPTLRLGISLAVWPNFMLKTNFGTGYKSPSLYQLYIDLPYFKANPLLKPEICRGWEGGISYSFLKKKVVASVLYFYNRVYDMISTNSSFTTMINVKSATTQGMEVSCSIFPTENINLKVDYTLTKTQDRQTHRPLYRRPLHKITGTVGCIISEKLTVEASGMGVGRQLDFDPQTYTPIYNKKFFIVNIRAQYTVTPRWEIFGRIDNLTNNRGEEPLGFQRTGIGCFIGIKGKL